MSAAPSPGRNGLIVFSSTRTSAGFGEVDAVRPDGSGRRNLTRDGADEAEPVLSPDGKRLAYVRANTLVVARPDGTQPVVVARAVDPGYTPLDPAGSPDGLHSQRLVAWTSRGILR